MRVRWSFRILELVPWRAVGFLMLGVLCITPQSALTADQPRTRTFHADISSEEEVEVKPSNGIGAADLTVDLATLKMNYRVSFKNLTSEPTQIALHGAIVRGMDAPVIVNLAPNGIKNPLQGTASITELQLEYLLNREVYISIATSKYKGGEIRGWFERRRDQPMNSLP
jgi:CHRD domain